MQLLVTAEMAPEDNTLGYSFRLGVKYRHRPGDFDSSGYCSHAVAEDAGRVDDAVNVSKARSSLCDHLLHLREIGHVAGRDEHLGTRGLHGAQAGDARSGGIGVRIRRT